MCVCVLGLAPAVAKLGREISQASGTMKVAHVLLHGPPRVGKSSVKRLILNQPPKKQDSTRLIEDPVRAISTSKFMKTSKSQLKEMDEEKLIQMIGKEIRQRNRDERSHRSQPTPPPPPTTPIPPPTTTPTTLPSSSSSTSSHSSSSVKQLAPRSRVLHKIAADLKSLDPSIPSLFQCHNIHLVDSGGQPQFTNLLPLLEQSQHHHLVVIRLDEKLSDKPRNRIEIDGTTHALPEALALTNYQLIERVCQLASGSESRVVVVGTHLDLESTEEPLAKKNELLAPLMEKYKYNLVPNTKGEPIFGVNAMVSAGDERNKYSNDLQRVLLDFPVLVDDDACDEGIVVPLRWIVLELELSRRSKRVGVIEKKEIDEVADALGVQDVENALKFFTRLGVLYYYPKALPDKIFTSITPISARLSDIVEACFLTSPATCKDRDLVKLQKTGELTQQCLKKLSRKLPADQIFPLEEFICLIRYLRILFDIDDNTFLFPSLLPVETESLAGQNEYQEPLLCFWENGDIDEVQILPQSFFHALIVDLLRKDNVKLNRRRNHSRSKFAFYVTLHSDRQCRVQLEDQVFWFEVRVDIDTSHEECKALLDIIQSCTSDVLHQLKLSNLGELQYGLQCSRECGLLFPHPSKCIDKTKFTFACLTEDYHWKETDNKKLFWFKGMFNIASFLLLYY